MLDSDTFREAMAHFASGVTIVTTLDETGAQRGFTASAFCSLSGDPPMVLSCLSGSAECHPAFLATQRFAVNVLRPSHRELALKFAARGENKFGGGEFVGGRFGMPVLPDALAVVECRVEATHPGGDHTILTGLVEHATAADGGALLYFRREFWELGHTHTPAPAQLD